MKLLQQLISIRSVSGEEDIIQDFIHAYLVKLGYEPIFYKGNVMVKISGQDTQKSLIFNAHSDTVAVGDISSWSHDPFKGLVKDGKIFGLGASDEKATIAVLLNLAKHYRKKQPECDIWLHFVLKEEVDGSGTQSCLEWFMKHERGQYKGVAGILGEPTNLSTIEIGHRGNVFLTCTTYGDSGHASDPSQIKTHAVFEMFSFMKKVEDLGEVWKTKYGDSFLGEPSIGMLTSISAGDIVSPNKFPDTCTSTLDIRTTPVLHGKVLSEIQKLDKKVKVVYTYPPLLFGTTQSDETIVAIAQSVTDVPLGMSTWSNDLCFFTEQGIPAIVYGPGNKERIHNANEFCELDNLSICLRQYQEIIKEFGDTE